MSFELPKLKYAHDALEPHIDEKTMTIHHGKHHQGYTNKLNAAIEGTDLEGKTIENILTNLEMSNTAVRNNGGGFFSLVLLKLLKTNFQVKLEASLVLVGLGFVYKKVVK